MHVKEKAIMPLFKEFVDIVPEPVYWVDLEHRVLGMSSLGLKLIGAKSKNDILGKTAFDFYPERIAKKLIKNQEEVIRTNKKLCFEETIEDITTGEVKVFDATIAPLYDEQKNRLY